MPMKSPVLFCLGGLTIAALYVANALAGCGPQSTDAPPPAQSAPPVVGKMKVIRKVTTPPQATPAPKKMEEGIDQLIRRLEILKAQKAELEKAEKEVVALLKEKLEQQTQLLQKLGVLPDPTGCATISPASSRSNGSRNSGSAPVQVPVPVVPPISY
jgi:hypothetical protein